MTGPLATPDQLAAYLGETPAASADFMLAAASAFARSYCGWSITYEEGVEWTLDAAGGRLLALPTLHLLAVHGIYVYGELVDDLNELQASANGVLYRPAGWPNAFSSVMAVVDHGYEQTPADVLAVVCSIASRMLTAPGMGSSLTGYRVGNVQYTWRDGAESVALTQVEQLALDRYRIAKVR